VTQLPTSARYVFLAAFLMLGALSPVRLAAQPGKMPLRDVLKLESSVQPEDPFDPANE